MPAVSLFGRRRSQRNSPPPSGVAAGGVAADPDYWQKPLVRPDRLHHPNQGEDGHVGPGSEPVSASDKGRSRRARGNCTASTWRCGPAERSPSRQQALQPGISAPLLGSFLRMLGEAGGGSCA
jgi:hypothetical protein